jgi:signal transduction histidine kinase
VRFRSQLVIGYSALMLVTIVTGVSAVIGMRVTTSRIEHVANDLGADVTELQRMRYQAEGAVAATRRYLLDGDERAAQRFTDQVIKLDATLGELDRRRDQLVPGMAAVDDAVRSYVQVAREVMAERSSTTVAAVFEQQVSPVRDRLEATIADFVKRERAAFERESASAHDFAERMQGVLAIATATGVFLSIALAWLWIRKLAQRYAREREATETARRAAAARDEMLAIVSHDLRNPLAAIAMSKDLLEHDLRSPRAPRHLAAIGSAAKRMEHLIGELLDIAKLDAGKLELAVEPCAVEALFEATLALFSARALEAGVAIAATGDGLVVVADRERVLQVLANLVGNALKYTPAGGRVSLAARAVGDTGGAVRIEIADTGPGIAADALPHVFERYWQARARGRGSLGLGLYICKQLVEAHHGRIGVDSQPGAGSTFWFEIPRSRTS